MGQGAGGPGFPGLIGFSAMRPAITGLLIALGSTAGLAGERETGEASDNEPTVEEILDNPLADEDYREKKSCLWRREIDSVEIVDESIVVFRGRIKKKVWANRLSQPCIGLRRDMVVTTRARSGSICRLDAIDARHRSASRFDPPVRCYLGVFEAIDELQVEAMKRAVDEHAKASRQSGPKSN